MTFCDLSASEELQRLQFLQTGRADTQPVSLQVTSKILSSRLWQNFSLFLKMVSLCFPAAWVTRCGLCLWARGAGTVREDWSTSTRLTALHTGPHRTERDSGGGRESGRRKTFKKPPENIKKTSRKHSLVSPWSKAEQEKQKKLKKWRIYYW